MGSLVACEGIIGKIFIECHIGGNQKFVTGRTIAFVTLLRGGISHKNALGGFRIQLGPRRGIVVNIDDTTKNLRSNRQDGRDGWIHST